MGRIPAPKTLRTEDFPADQQEMVGKIAFVINNYLDQLYSLVNGNIDFANLAQNIRTISVTTDGAGAVTTLPLRVNPELNRRIVGVQCLAVRNPANPTAYVQNTPFISFTSEPGRVNILNIGGLPPNSQLTLTLLLIGE